MKDNRLTEIVTSLPASIPFVAPEEHERSVRQKFAARIGANENCYGPSPKVLEAIKNVSGDIWKYPDPTAFDLKNELAKGMCYWSLCKTKRRQPNRSVCKSWQFC